MTSKQKGLTLIEMILAVSVVVLVLSLTMTSFNQDGQRAESLQARLQMVRAVYETVGCHLKLHSMGP